MEIRTSEQQDIPRLRLLWQEAFGDADDYLDAFFSTAWAPERCLCAVEGPAIAAALYWIPCTRGSEKLAYVYAVATAKAFRRQGLCRALMEQLHSLLVRQGYAGALLVPENEDLARMYLRFGYRPFPTWKEVTCCAEGAALPLRKLTKEDYASLRRQLLPEGSVLQEGAGLDFLDTQLRFYAGDRLLLACRAENGRLFCGELLGDPAAAPGILTALSCREGTFRIPGSGEGFAMFRPLTSNSRMPAYFGFPYD